MGLWKVSEKPFTLKRLMSYTKPLFKILDSEWMKHKIPYWTEEVEVNSNKKPRFEYLFDKFGQSNFIESLTLDPLLFVFSELFRKGFNRSRAEWKASYLKNNTVRKIVYNGLNTLRYEGLKEPIRFWRPPMIVWNFTYLCNEKCKHCYEDAGALGGKKPEASLEERIELLNKLEEAKISAIFFSGGEPTIHPDFLKIARLAKEKGFYLSIATNGTLFSNRKFAEEIAEVGFGYFAVSLDGTEAVHDSFRGNPGMWQRTVEGINNLIELGQSIFVQYCPTKANYSREEFKKMLSYAEDLDRRIKQHNPNGRGGLILYKYIPVGRGSFELDLPPEETEVMLEIATPYIEKGLFKSTAPQLARYCKVNNLQSVVAAHYGESTAVVADVIGGCGAGRAYAALQPDGRLTPCVYMPYYTIGNLLFDSFEKLWNDPKLKELARRDNLEGSCGICEYNKVCGGCRARAYAYTGHFNGPDPTCIKNKEYYYEKLSKQSKKNEVVV